MVKDVSPKQDALAQPTDFEYVYYSHGAKFDYGVSIWRPRCPPNYVALGFVVNVGGDKPSIASTLFRCVNQKITTSAGKWTRAWNDAYTYSQKDITMWRADAATIRGDSVSVWALSVILSYGNMESAQPLLLNAANVSLRSQKPIKSVKLKNFIYDYANQVVVSKGPSEITDLKRVKVSNCRE